MRKSVYLVKTDCSRSREREMALLRSALKEEYGDGKDLPPLRYGERGKPYFEDGSVFFSLSHSGDYVACVFDSAEIGLDLQKIRAVPERVARRYLLRAGGDDRAQTLEWTKFESYVKMTGEGIVLHKRTDYSAGVFLSSYDLPGYVLTVCGSVEHYAGLAIRYPE